MLKELWIGLLHWLGFHDWQECGFSYVSPLTTTTLQGEPDSFMPVLHGASHLYFRCSRCPDAVKEVIVSGNFRATSRRAE